MIINFENVVNGSPADATSVALSDPTNTFGVRRTDTGAVVVADATALTRTGVGQYSYAFADPADGLTYEYWVEVVYQGETYRLQKFSAGPTLAGGMSVGDARAILQAAARNGGDSSYYDPFKLDLALQNLLRDFILRSKCTTVSGDFVLTAGSTDLPFSGGSLTATAGTLTGFRPELLVLASFPGVAASDTQGDRPIMEEVDYAFIRDLQVNEPLAVTTPPQQALPRFICFDTQSSGSVYPMPDQAYSVRLHWAQPLVSWTMGSTDSTLLSTTLINIPTDYAQTAIALAGVFFLQFVEPESQAGSATGWQQYLAHCEMVLAQGPGRIGRRSVRYARPRGAWRPLMRCRGGDRGYGSTRGETG